MIIVITISLYLLTIFTLPFNGVTATIFLFALMAFWSRLPGVGIPHPLLVLYYMDFVDIFTMLIAVNVGPMPAIAFTLFTNYASRAVGVYPHWVMVIKDGLSQSMVCLLIPFVHGLLGGDILMTVVAYTLLRAVGFFILWMIWPPWGLIKQLTVQISENAVVLAINILYAKIFGSFLDNLLKKGVQFNWLLFVFATIVILFFYFSLYGINLATPKKAAKRLVKNVIKKENIVDEVNIEFQELHEFQEIKKSLDL